MDPMALARRRLANLGLGDRVLPTAAAVVHPLGAIQSQDYGPAKWSTGERINGRSGPATDAGIDRSFTDGNLLRTHVLRPTWHFVLPEDIRWLLALTAPRIHALNAYYYRQFELDEVVRGRSRELLAGALPGRQLTRGEIAAIFAAAGISAAGLRLGYLLMSAELTGLICSGPRRGNQHTYALLDERAPATPRIDRDEALSRVVWRYFTSHGPATVKDCAHWSSLPMTDLKRGLDIYGATLEREMIGGVAYWGDPCAPPAATTPARVHLLQGYDEYLVGYSETKFVLDVSGAARSQPPARGVFNHVLLIDGQVAGRRRRTQKKDSVLIEVAPFAPLDRASSRALQDAADRHGQFLGVSATVAVSG